MKRIKLADYLKGKTKKRVAEDCDVSPAMIAKALEETDRDYRVQIDGENISLVRKQDPWRVVTRQAQRPGTRTRNY